jgi:A/G-specific adenine glycosylase
LNQHEVLLEKRPPVGIWGGLWSFPECPPDVAVADWCQEQWGLALDAVQTWDVLRHSFSHFHLDITPVRAEVRQAVPRVMEGGRFLWYNVRKGEAPGLAVPVRRLLTILANDF